MRESDPYQIVKDFEEELCNYTGAKYAVTTNSCTNALLLSLKYHQVEGKEVSMPKYNYMSPAMSVINAGGRVHFTDEEWEGLYQLEPYPIWDSARFMSSDMYMPGQFICLSFHWKKTLALGTGGAILHDDDEADVWLRKARFNGRTEGLTPQEDDFDIIGHQCHMIPRDAAEGLSRLSFLPEVNQPLPNDDYPDLSTKSCFSVE